MEIGEVIKQARIKKGMSQAELAERIGYKSRSSINKIEVGERDASITVLIKISKVLDIPFADLVINEVYQVIVEKMKENSNSDYHNFLNGKSEEEQLKFLKTAFELMIEEDEYDRSELLDCFDLLNSRGKIVAIEFIHGLTLKDEYTKKD